MRSNVQYLGFKFKITYTSLVQIIIIINQTSPKVGKKYWLIEFWSMKCVFECIFRFFET